MTQTFIDTLADTDFPAMTDLSTEFGPVAARYIDLFPGFQAINFINADWVIEGKRGELFMVSHFESRPAAMYLTEL